MIRQFDVVKLTGGELCIVLQSDLLSELTTRVVVPLVPVAEVKPTPRLHPTLHVGRREFVVAMEQMTSVRTSHIDKAVGSARTMEYEIKRAYDIVLAGI